MKLQHLLCTALLLTTSTAIHAATPNHTDSVYVFTYHSGPFTDGLKVAYSFDLHHWTPVGNNYSFVKSDYSAWGRHKRMYNPTVLFNDGEFFAVWALTESANQFAITRTPNLWLWKPQDYPYMSNQENVAEPLLTKQNGQFQVLYTTSQGRYYITTSTDFQHWGPAIETSAQAFNTMKQQLIKHVSIRGEQQEGTINRVPTFIVENLVLRVGEAESRNRRYGESTRDDERRFRDIKHLEANLNIDLNDTKAISPHLIGIFFEDINYSADGGLYAELIQNRDFEYNELDRGEWNAKTNWELRGNGTTWDISTTEPIHANNAHYSVLNTTQVGASLCNNGFDGIALKKGDKYDLGVFLKSLDGKSQKVRILLLDGDKVLAETTFTAGKDWKQQKAVLRPSDDATKAVLSVQPLTTGQLAIDFVSLFPQNTFKNRKNGLRADLAQTLADLHPRFVRFPGGCLSHGDGIENMYRWRETVGPLWERKPQSNIWHYHQTKGLGFFEYFQFCEDIGAEPLPVLPAGVPCQNSSRGGGGQQGGLPMSEMEAYTQELLDLIEWANGDAKTSPLARLRAEAGHPKPFNLKYLGIGNEDLISDVFTERFNFIYHRIRAAHPEIQVVGTVGPFFEGSDYEYGWRLARQENIPIVDEHYYVAPGWYIHNQDFYDRYDRNGTKVYLGEWASRGNNLENALAEALHITNLERNADVVVMSSYAPLLAKHGNTQWNPDLIYFNNTEVFPTVNYYVQKLCGQNSGTQYIRGNLSVQVVRDDRGNEVRHFNTDATLRVNSSVVRDEKTGDLIIKLVNITNQATHMNINLGTTGFAAKAHASVISGQPSDRENRPTESDIDVADTFAYNLPPYSFSVIRIPAKK